jgi:hypothetical protein
VQRHCLLGADHGINTEIRIVPLMNLSGLLCVRHTMSSERSMYAEASEEDAEGERCCASSGVAEASPSAA